MDGRRPAEDAAVGESDSKKARIAIAVSNDEPEQNRDAGRRLEVASVIPGLDGRSANENGLSEGTSVADIPQACQAKGKGRQLDLDGTSPGPSTAATSTAPTNPPPPPRPKQKNSERTVKPPPSSSSAETILDLFRQDFLDRDKTKEHVLALEGDSMETIVRKKLNLLKCLHFGRPVAPLLEMDSDDLMTS